MIAPLLGGLLLGLNVSWPVYASAATFFGAAICSAALPFESAADVEDDGAEKDTAGGGEYTLLH